MTQNQRHTVGYVLRLWQSGNGKYAVWRASLQCIETGKRRAFSSIDALMSFFVATSRTKGSV